MSSLGILLWWQLLFFVIRTINVKISSGNILTLSTNRLYTCNPFFFNKKNQLLFISVTYVFRLQVNRAHFPANTKMSKSNLEPPLHRPPANQIHRSVEVVNNYNFQNSICGSRFQRRVCSFPHIRNHYILYGTNNTHCNRKQWQ